MSDQHHLNCTCGCGGGRSRTPDNTENLPGLAGLKYRVGTHSTFKESMLEAIANYPALGRLTSRSDGDMAVATLDAWATVLDVLSFYQERVINEGFLRTATERVSVLQLGNHISYTLRPGVSASCSLAFSMSESPGAPLTAIIPARTKVQSVPAQNQLPQIYETIQQIQARVSFNAIKILSKKKINPVFNDTQIFLQGIVTNLQKGDGILIVGDERLASVANKNWDFRKVSAVTTNRDLDSTTVILDSGLGAIKGGVQRNPASENVRVFAMRQKAALFGYNAPEFRLLSGSLKSQNLPAGLTGSYFKGRAFEHFAMSRIDPEVNNDWGPAAPPGTPLDPDDFSIQWTGMVLAPVTGDTTFYTQSDDGVRLWINDQLIINNWTIHGSTEDQSTLWLQAGQLYKITLQYFEGAGSAQIQLFWSAPGLSKQIIPSQNLSAISDNEWPGFQLSAIAGNEADTVYLDSVYPKIVRDSWVVLSAAGQEEIYNATSVSESSRKNFTLAGKSTKISLGGQNLMASFDAHVRDTTVYGQSEALQMAEQPVDNAIGPDKEITLATLVPGLAAGQPIILSGKRRRIQLTASSGDPLFLVSSDPVATRYLSSGDSLIVIKKPGNNQGLIQQWSLKDKGGFEGIMLTPTAGTLVQPSWKDDETVSELHIIDYVVSGTDPTVIVLKDEVSNFFDPPTVSINANVVVANHGETKQELLGSGSSATSFQRFTLKQTPLTYTPDASASGTKTTLQVRVNDLLWREAPTFYQTGPKDKIYTVRVADDGKVTIKFGDGKTGSRLPTGSGNVTASYRVGIGNPGLLHSGQLSMLLTPQLGVSKVVNPLETSGAADPESAKDARQNLPFTVLTLDRIVSIADYENFARSFAGIAKARAEMVWNGQQQEVHITIAAGGEEAIQPTSPLFIHLTRAIRLASHNYNVVKIDSYSPITFSVSAAIQVDAQYDFQKVKAVVIWALQDHFSFEARDFGQDVTLSEIMTVIQDVEGVVFTDVALLDGGDPMSAAGLQRIRARTAAWQQDSISPAAILFIKEITITAILS